MSEKKISKKGIFIVLVLGALITSLMSTVMSTALPAIMSSFNIAADQAQLVTSMYSLVSGIVIIATAIIIRWVPTKPLFFVSMGIFTVGILLCAISPNFILLLIGRVIQGIGYGILISLTQVVILTIVSAARRGLAMGLYGLAVVFAPVLGPIVAGVIIDHTSWKLIFWIVLVMCVIDLILGLMFMENVLPTSPQHLDVLSMLLAAIGFTGLVLGAGNMGSYPFISLQVGLLFLIGLIAIVLFAIRQQRLEHPLLNLKVFKNRDFIISVIVSIILYALMNAMSAIMPIFIQSIMGKSATSFGIAVAPCALCLAAFSPLTGKLYDKMGLKALAVIGSILLLISNGAVLFIDENVPIVVLMILLGLLGIGLSGMQMNVVTYGMADFSDEDKTDGTALLSSLRTIGAALGTAVFVAIMSMGVTDNAYTVADVHRSYLVMTVLTVATLTISIFLIKGRKQTRKEN